MNTDTSFHFLLIEDNHFDTRIAEKVLENLSRCLSVKTFSDASLALTYIEEKGTDGPPELTFILLDMYMPLMGGFDFLDVYEKFPAEIRNRYKVLLLSSSINLSDVAQANEYPSIFAAVEKPVSEGRLIEHLNRV